jgi:hypothetical protein
MHRVKVRISSCSPVVIYGGTLANAVGQPWRKTYPKTRWISWCLALEEDSRSQDTSNCTEADLQGTPDRSFRLHADIIGLICQNRRDVALTASLSEENTAVPHVVVCRIRSPESSIVSGNYKYYLMMITYIINPVIPMQD